MATFSVIPLDELSAWYEYDIVLDSVTYTLEIYYNTRADRWRLSIKDAVGNPLLSGIPLLVNRDLTGPYTYLDIPKWFFVVLDDKLLGREPGLQSFLLDHTLYYVEPP